MEAPRPCTISISLLHDMYKLRQLTETFLQVNCSDKYCVFFTVKAKRKTQKQATKNFEALHNQFDWLPKVKKGAQ